MVLDPNAKALVVPISAVTQFAGAEKVWLVVNNLSAQREIIAGSSRNGAIEVIDGLVEGDVVLADAEHGHIAHIVPLPKPSMSESKEAEPVHAVVNDAIQTPEG